MKNICFLLIFVVALLLSSCASNKSNAPKSLDQDAVTVEAEAIEIPSREAVFVYGNSGNLPRRIILNIGGEPILLPRSDRGYVRLVGVVSGRRATACLEIGGRGLALSKGEQVDDYRVVGINDRYVVLERRQPK